MCIRELFPPIHNYSLAIGETIWRKHIRIMKKLSIVLTIFAGLFLASCSTGRYATNSQNLNLNQTQVVLSEANFKVVKQVQTYVVYSQKLKFDAQQLKQSAYAQLVKEAELTGSQTIVNVTMEQVQREKMGLLSGFLGFRKYDNAILVSGTVIEFIK